MKFKSISKFLTIGILLNSFNLSSFAGTLSEDTRYETFKDNSITISDILEEDKVNVEIEGNTLVNVLNLNKIIKNNGWTYDVDERRGYVNLASSSNDWTELNFDINKDIEPGKEYTMFINITKNTLVRDDGSSVDRVVKIAINSDTGDNNVFFLKHNQTGIVKHVFTPNESTSRKPYISIIPNVGNGEFEFKDFMIVEGNHIDKDVGFFEGIKSVGELEDNNLKITSQTQNLFNTNNLYAENYNGLNNNATYSVSGDSIFISKQTSGGNFIGTRIKCKRGQPYTAGFIGGRDNNNSPYTIYVYNDKPWGDVIFSFTNSSTTELVTRTFIPDSDEFYIGLYMGSTVEVDEVLEFKNVFVNEGNNTNYIRYEENSIKLMLNEPLRSLPNGVKDKVIKKDGQWFVERNIAIKNLDKNFTDIRFIDDRYQTENTLAISIYLPDRAIAATKGNNDSILSDKLLTHNYSSILYSDELEGLFSDSTYKNIYCRFLKSNLSSYDKAGIIDYFTNNPTTILYELENPIYEPLNINLSANLYLDITYIINNSAIPANMKVVVDRVLNRAVEAIELAQTAPTIENIAIARMWTNLTKESTKKDELQNLIDSMVDIKDLEIEKQTVSANVDLYIKSKNTLSMSLNTNYITFEDYSLVEDLERLNAVEINISSSLPYSLNAYLEAPIVNSDNSSTIEPNILNIKESSDTNYQAFKNINEQIVLNSDCESGNNNLHNIDIKLAKDTTNKADIYKTTIKLEAVQK